MVKQLVEFKSEDNLTSLEISAYDLTPEEHNAIIKELATNILKEGIRFTLIDKDSVQAFISSDDYWVVWDFCQKLLGLGWQFTTGAGIPERS
jgi:hypothetical protein